MITIFSPAIPEEAVERATATLRSGWISEGRQVREFEEDFCRYLRLPRALAVNSGTAALHLALLGAGVGSGDEVITTCQSFVATAMAVLYAGAHPVFADLQPGGTNLDPKDVERRVGERTKAIVVVHYGGYPCDMDEFHEIGERHGLAVVEDAAHALGATYRGQPVGSLGDFAVFSFQAIKQLTTGDGGMLVCNMDEDHRSAYRRRWFGIDREGRKSSELGQPAWDISEVGYKYHMNDIAASLGIAQLPLLGACLEQRRELNHRYRSELDGLDGISLLHEEADREGACWLFTVLVERRLDFIRAMRARGVEATVHHDRIDRNSLFGGLRDDVPVQDAFSEQQVCLPLRHSLTDDEATAVLTAVKRGW